MKREGSDSEEFIPTRQSLLERLKCWEDQESWRDFFDTYWRLIYGAAVKSGLNDAEAQDVVQDTVIIVARKMEDFKYDPAVDSFKGWLLYLTRKQIAQQYRKRAREHGGGGRARNLDELTQELEEIPEQAGAGLEALWEQEWERNLWDAAIAKVRLILRANGTYRSETGDRNTSEGSFSLREAPEAWMINLKCQTGPLPGKTLFCIYERKGDELI